LAGQRRPSKAHTVALRRFGGCGSQQFQRANPHRTLQEHSACVKHYQAHQRTAIGVLFARLDLALGRGGAGRGGLGVRAFLAAQGDAIVSGDDDFC
jgi:hypothetical protein